MTEIIDTPPPATANERRMVHRMGVLWSRLRRNKPIPAMSDLDPRRLPTPWSSCFVLPVIRGDGPGAFDFIGADLRLDYGKDLTGQVPDDISAETLLGAALKDLREAVAGQQPVVREGSIEQGKTERILFRSILLPFGHDRQTPDTVVGAVSWTRRATEQAAVAA